MSVRVNLLPREAAERNQAVRQRAGLGIAAVVLLALLGLLYFLRVNEANDVQARLETEQAVVAELQAELAALAEYRELAQRRDDAIALLSAALAPETSYAGVLQDVAAVFPDDAELSALTVTTLDVEGGAATAELGDVRIPYGEVTAVGRTLAQFAPGVERLLLDFGKVAAFTEVFLTSSVLDEDEAVAFTVEIDLGQEIRTGRYAQGLPEALR